MDPNSPLSPPAITPLHSVTEETSGKIAGTMEAAREKLQEAQHLAREKMEAVGQKTSEAMNVAREKIEGAGSSLLQWARENPATALATFFASGLVIGCALTLQRHEKTFGERLHDDPGGTLRDALYSAMLPLRDGVQGAAASARSLAGDVVDRVKHANKGHFWN